VAADFDLDARPDVLAAETAGAGRIVLFHRSGHTVLAAGEPVIQAAAADLNGDARPDVLVLRRASISWYENRPPVSR
jgi:hypothetical protein